MTDANRKSEPDNPDSATADGSRSSSRASRK